MNTPTKIFLVLLQIAIGWHFLYEGFYKVGIEKTWSSRGYLSAANGPTAPAMRWSAGDPAVKRDGVNFVLDNPSVAIAEYFTIKPINQNLAASERRLHQHLPPALAKEWDGYFTAFLQHYGLDKATFDEKDLERLPPEYLGTLAVNPASIAGAPWGAIYVTATPQAWMFEKLESPDPRMQRILAERRFRQMKADTVAWLIDGKKKVRRPNISGPAAEVTVSVQQRVHEYEQADARAKELAATRGSMFGYQAVPEAKKARDEANAIRTELLADIKDRTNQMKQSLRGVLSRDQHRMAEVPSDKTPASWSRIRTIDNMVRYGLLTIGAFLVLGVFTRTACWAGALFLLSFYLAMPALPWLPEPPMAEGHYLFINKNIIEMLALLALAFSQPYLRYGFDVWLHPLVAGANPWRRTSKAKTRIDLQGTVVVPVPAESEAGEVVTTHPTMRSDSPHAS